MIATLRNVLSGVAESVMFAEVFSFLLFLRLAFLLGPLRNRRAPSERYLDAVRCGHTSPQTLRVPIQR
jgi:hypothetical protein